MMIMSTITINGKTYITKGNDISIIDGIVSVDGNIIEAGLSGNVKITWDGPLANLRADGDVTCENVNGKLDAGGNIHIKGNVNSNVNSGGSVHVSGNVGGNVQAGGSITAKDVGGYARASGSLHCNSHH